MKITFGIAVALLSLVWYSGPVILAVEETGESGEEWESLLDQTGEDPLPPGEGEAAPLNPRSETRMENPEKRPVQEKEHPAPAEGRGPGFGPGRGMGRPFFAQTDPEVLLEFLRQHEPELAARLEAMKEENPRQYRHRVHMLGRMYGPVIEQMKLDPEMAGLTLQRIKQRLKVENTLKIIHTETKSESSKQMTGQLRSQVAGLFDIILQQEQLRLSQWQSQITEWSVPDESGGKADPNEGKDKGPARGMAQERMRKLQERLKEHQVSLENWKSRRELIIDAHMEELLNNYQPFPWGR
jgi:hypothetical protein